MLRVLKDILKIIIKEPLYFYHALQKEDHCFQFTIFKYGKYDKKIKQHMKEMNTLFPDIQIKKISHFVNKDRYYLDFLITTNKKNRRTCIKNYDPFITKIKEYDNRNKHSYNTCHLTR